MSTGAGEEKWLVTGATGMLGGAFVKKWAHRCVAMTRRPRDLPCEQISTDFSDHNALQSAILKIEPKACFHFAACTDLALCEREPALADSVNVQITRQIAQACAQINARMVYMSTDSVFDGMTGGYREEDAPQPLNVYANTKWKGEGEARRASPDHLVIRGNLFGTVRGNSSGLKLYDWALHSLATQTPVTGFTDVVFNPLSVESLSLILGKMIIARLNGGIWHVGSSTPLSKDEFIRVVADAHGLQTNNVKQGKQSDSLMFPRRPLKTWLRTGKIQRAGIEMPDIRTEIASLSRQP